MGKLGPFSENTIVVGDCLDIMAQMPDGCVDLVVTDPPYGAKGRAKWDVWLGVAWVAEIARLLRVGGSAYAFVGYSHAPELALAFRRVLSERTWITWWKRNSALSQVNNWKSQSEYILYFVRGEGWAWNRWNILEPFETKAGERDSPYDGKVPGNVWLIPGVNWCSSERTEHPTQKPLAIIERIIKASSNQDDMVADFFVGSGTTAIVADRLGRKFFGCDINPDYVEMALQRLEKDRAGRQLQLL